VLYGAATDQVQEFSYRIKATNAGSYIVPAAYGASMYDSKVRARSVAGRVTVEQR
jgi:alpha-2-macroglobulin